MLCFSGTVSGTEPNLTHIIPLGFPALSSFRQEELKTKYYRLDRFSSTHQFIYLHNIQIVLVISFRNNKSLINSAYKVH